MPLFGAGSKSKNQLQRRQKNTKSTSRGIEATGALLPVVTGLANAGMPSSVITLWCHLDQHEHGKRQGSNNLSSISNYMRLTVNHDITFGDLKSMLLAQQGLTRGTMTLYKQLGLPGSQDHLIPIGLDNRQFLRGIVFDQDVVHCVLVEEEDLSDVEPDSIVRCNRCNFNSQDFRSPIGECCPWCGSDLTPVAKTSKVDLYLSSRKKPALQTWKQAFRPTQPLSTPSNGPAGFGDQRQEDIDLQRAIRLSAAMKDPPSESQGYSTITAPASLSLPQKPSNDANGGHLVAQGSISQYSVDGGGSACTSICLVAMEGFLRKWQQEGGSMQICPSDLDSWVQLGVWEHAASGRGVGHVSVEEAWEAPSSTIAANMRSSLDKKGCLQGSVTSRASVFSVFQRVLDLAAGHEWLSVLWTKSGETILCWWCQSSLGNKGNNRPASWYLFDSHGQSHEVNTKRVYLKEFCSLDQLVEALLVKYPSQHFDDRSLQGDMYNQFEVYPVVQRSREQMSATLENSSASVLDSTSETSEAAPCRKPAPVQAKSEDLGHGDPVDPRSNDPQHCLIQRTEYEDPVTYEIMADPVACDDGHTYERSVIERFFRERILLEQERQEQEESAQAGTTQQRDDDTCCGARPPIELISPLSGEVVSGNLFPVIVVEQQIVRLVEAKALDMTEEEVASWHERREEKKRNDRDRNELKRQQRERLEQMRRNAEEAERNRSEEESNAHPELDPAFQFRLEGTSEDTDDQQNYLGISVCLTDKSSWIPTSFLGGAPRCMLPYCRALLDKHGWCSRCGSLACETCLAFQVTDMVEPFPAEKHNICFDCMCQIADYVLSGDDVRTRQKRAVILRAIEWYLVRLGNHAATKQDLVIQHEVQERVSSQLQEEEQAIERLEEQLRDLSQRAQVADSRAKEARENDGSSGGTETSDGGLQELAEKCASLRNELNELQARGLPEVDSEIIAHIQSLEDTANRLETAETELAMARSSILDVCTDAKDVPTAGENRTSNVAVEVEVGPKEADEGQFDAVQEKVALLRQEYTELLERAHPVAENELVAHFESVTSVSDELERAETELAMLRSTIPFRAAAVATNGVVLQSAALAKCRNVESNSSTSTSRGTTTLVEKMEPTPMTSSATLVEFPNTRRLISDLRGHLAKPVGLKGALLGRKKRSRNSNLATLVGLLEDIVTMPGSTVNWDHADNVLVQISVHSLPSPLRQLLATARTEVTDIRISRHQSSTIRETQAIEPTHPSEESLRPESQQPSSAASRETQADKPTLHQSEESGFLRDKVVVVKAEPTHPNEESLSPESQQPSSASRETRADKPTLHKIEESGFLPDKAEVAKAREDLAAIGERVDDWPLPLGLEYPTSRMEHQMDILRNTLSLRRAESLRTAEAKVDEQLDALASRREELENEIIQAQRAVQDAESIAQAEESQLRRREEEHRARLEARRERERQRQAEIEQARREAEELRERHQAELTATNEAFARARTNGASGGARTFGGIGDLRMCRRCHLGPIENKACTDLKAHNDSSSVYKGNTVMSTQRPNNCPHCNWHDPDWHNWPYWDGIYGVH